jgi:hypothetical protein
MKKDTICNYRTEEEACLNLVDYHVHDKDNFYHGGYCHEHVVLFVGDGDIMMKKEEPMSAAERMRLEGNRPMACLSGLDD